MNPHIIKKPVISERSLSLAKKENRFTFEVAKSANKNQIKEAIEELFSVNVVSINTITGHRTPRSTGRKRLKTIAAPVKKAVVKLKSGQAIDLFEFNTAE